LFDWVHGFRETMQRLAIALALVFASGCGPGVGAGETAARYWNCKNTDLVREGTTRPDRDHVDYRFYGCGHRGVVACQKDSAGDWRCDPPDDLRLPTSNGGCSKDTDCKGDRVCVQSQCTDAPARGVPSAPTVPASD
jgi:hypothetical protein